MLTHSRRSRGWTNRRRARVDRKDHGAPAVDPLRPFTLAAGLFGTGVGPASDLCAVTQRCMITLLRVEKWIELSAGSIMFS